MSDQAIDSRHRSESLCEPWERLADQSAGIMLERFRQRISSSMSSFLQWADDLDLVLMDEALIAHGSHIGQGKCSLAGAFFYALGIEELPNDLQSGGETEEASADAANEAAEQDQKLKDAFAQILVKCHGSTTPAEEFVKKCVTWYSLVELLPEDARQHLEQFEENFRDMKRDSEHFVSKHLAKDRK